MASLFQTDSQTDSLGDQNYLFETETKTEVLAQHPNAGMLRTANIHSVSQSVKPNICVKLGYESLSQLTDNTSEACLACCMSSTSIHFTGLALLSISLFLAEILYANF